MKLFCCTLTLIALLALATTADAGNRYWVTTGYAPAPVVVAPTTTYYAPAAAATTVVARRPILRPWAPPAYIPVGGAVVAPAPVVTTGYAPYGSVVTAGYAPAVVAPRATYYAPVAPATYVAPAAYVAPVRTYRPAIVYPYPY